MIATSRENKERRTKRRKDTAEDFTPPELAKQMLDKLPKEIWEENKTFLDPACGNGNLLVPVLIRKLQHNHDSLQAIKTIYGVDIKDDNINECRLRLLKILKEHNIKITKEHVRYVLRNLRVTRLSKFENGALDYDFSFSNKDSSKDIANWMKKIEDGALDCIETANMDDEDEEETQNEDEQMAWLLLTTPSGKNNEKIDYFGGED